MLALIISRSRKLKIPHHHNQKDWIFIGSQFLFPPQNAAATTFIKSFSSKPLNVKHNANNDSKQSSSFTISYLINSCGLSPDNAVSTSQKICIKSPPENPDAVLNLLTKYGFTTTNHIPTLVKRWPRVLFTCPEKILLPKLKFFCSFGVPLATLADRLSAYPMILQRSLDNYLVPAYTYLRDLLKSDEKVVAVFKRASKAFAHGWQREIPVNIALLRARGVPESLIVKLVLYHPNLIVIGDGKLAGCMDRVEEMGFDKSRVVFLQALQVFANTTESILKRKMEVYREWGWSEFDISDAFLRYPLCMATSEKKIMANMDFFVNEVGCAPAAVARCPIILNLSLEKRMRPRWLVVGILKSKKLLTKQKSFINLFKLTEEMFLEGYILRYQQDIPKLLDFYRGKLSYSELVVSTQERSEVTE